MHVLQIERTDVPSVEQPVRSVLWVLSEGGGSRACWVKETHSIAVHFATCLASLLPCCHAAMLPCCLATMLPTGMLAGQAGGGGVGQLCLDIDRSTPGLVDQESSLVVFFFFSLLPFLNKVEEEDWEDDRINVGLRPGERSFWIWRLVLRLRQT